MTESAEVVAARERYAKALAAKRLAEGEVEAAHWSLVTALDHEGAQWWINQKQS